MHEEFFFLAILVMAQLWVQLGDGWSLLPANPVPFTPASLPVLSVFGARYVGSGVTVLVAGSGIRRVRSRITQPLDQGSQVMGLGSAVF